MVFSLTGYVMVGGIASAWLVGAAFESWKARLQLILYAVAAVVGTALWLWLDPPAMAYASLFYVIGTGLSVQAALVEHRGGSPNEAPGVAGTTQPTTDR